MQLLKTSFRKNGYNYELLKREGTVCLFEQFKSIGSTRYYEVLIVRLLKERYINKKKIPAREALPSNNMFGVYGWGYDTLEMAQQKKITLLNVKNASTAAKKLVSDFEQRKEWRKKRAAEASKKEEQKSAKDLTAILSFIDKLKEVDIEGVEPMAQATGLRSVTRADESFKRNEQSRAKLLANAPEAKGGYIKVKAVFE